MYKKVFTVIQLILAFAAVTALDKVAESNSIICTFGQIFGNAFSRGIVLSETETVRASDSGKVLFILKDSRNGNTFPSTLGTAVIIIHDDEMMTTYANLETESVPDIPEEIERGTIVGKAGSTGFTQPNTLEFHVSDRRHSKRINPLLLLPVFYTDDTSPVIKNVYLKNDKTAYQSTARRVKQGEYVLCADITDTPAKQNKDIPIAPFQISVTQNGHEIQNVIFETLKEENGRLKLTGTESMQESSSEFSRSFEEAFDGFSLVLGAMQLKRGKNELTITARDIAGNISSYNWLITAE